MAKVMLDADRERAMGQLAVIEAGVGARGYYSQEWLIDLAAARESLETGSNPRQTGIELIALAEGLVDLPDLWNRTTRLASELLAYPLRTRRPTG